MSTSVFLAYPSKRSLIKDAISEAVDLSSTGSISLRPWEKMNILGFKLDDLIRQQIDAVDGLLADVTYPNGNVFYELGYAIGRGKPVLPILHEGVDGAVTGVQKTGLFDTTGWLGYSNGVELLDRLQNWQASAWTSKYERRRNHNQPLFVLDTLVKTDFRNHIFHAIDNSYVQKRSFDPAEIPRLTAAQAVAEISASAGVVIPKICTELLDSIHHTLRASFLLGLCHGYAIEPLAIQYENSPVAIDYRDFVRNSTFKRETEKYVVEYCEKTLIWNQSSVRDDVIPAGILEMIDLGSPAAENEKQRLGQYFVKTAEYAAALRAEGAVVIGRKGSAKSAVFLQVVADQARNRRTCIVDLRPASHNLSEVRSALLSFNNTGVFDHTIAAFWQYIIYVEILLKIREMVLPASRNDFTLQERVRAIEEGFSLNESVVSGDFTSRLGAAVREVLQFAERLDDVQQLRRQLTNIVFEQPISALRESIVSFREFFDDILFLIDDIDKGWPPKQVERQDIITVLHLIEELNRIRRDLGKRRVDFRHLVFLRSDVYEQLVEQTPDRGKYNPINVDWSDPEQLRHLLQQRVYSTVNSGRGAEAWAAMNPILEGSDAVTLLIRHSLRRPRFLIDLCERTLSFAINRGHDTVRKADVDDAIRQMSLYLVSDFGYEMRDIAGTPEDIFLGFVGSSDLRQ
jgi:hypothetical protein